ncbi:hypothetical protein A3742_03845 [Oleiphilus sp. HI0071]|nr:hypothetical protein A3742_26840 [Oleiphilus sp. HI0071]KZY87830.1 hypothetical protein A3742_03845 [Oleiphilus sp. HI0071]KZY89252.1 hypothetical protein A3744_06800 [Oleiphilus sp. HI0073]KZZ51249.1 hypothetical protein A3760_01570 [Oleiphilus sp. HI0122]
MTMEVDYFGAEVRFGWRDVDHISGNKLLHNANFLQHTKGASGLIFITYRLRSDSGPQRKRPSFLVISFRSYCPLNEAGFFLPK